MDISKLTLEEKIGQMLMFSFHGQAYNEQLERQIKEFKVGGVIHFVRNVDNCNQVTKLNKTIQDNAKIPLFIGVDQEGGTVQRIIKDVTYFPGAMALGATHNTHELQDIEKLTYYVGKDLKHMNYNMVFAPVSDVNNNIKNPVINSRSFGDDPDFVSKYVNSSFKGFEKALVIPTLKHFPGHGDTCVDSHVGLPVVNKTIEDIEKVELVPFKKAIEENVPGIMASHILYSSIDDVYPTSISKKVINDLLIKKLNYKGLIITDSLTMGAIYNNYTIKEIVKNGVNAGIDILMFCGKADIIEQANIVSTFKELVNENVISIDRINHSVQKILDYKEKYITSQYEEYVLPEKEGLLLGEKLSLDSITLVNSTSLLPLKTSDKVLVIFPKIQMASLVDNLTNDYNTIGKYLKQKNINVTEVMFDYRDALGFSKFLKSLNEEIKNSKKEIDYDKIIIATYNVSNDDLQQKLVNSLSIYNRSIIISLRSPYDYIYLNKPDSYICTYEATNLALCSLCECLIDKEKFKGKLPLRKFI